MGNMIGATTARVVSEMYREREEENGSTTGRMARESAMRGADRDTGARARRGLDHADGDAQ
jgi:hypothetical protein